MDPVIAPSERAEHYFGRAKITASCETVEMKLPQIDTTPIEGLVTELWDRGGTDIHISADMPPMFRIDGDLYPVEGHAAYLPEDIERMVDAMLPEELKETFLAHRQVDFSFSWKERTRFRGNVYRQQGAASIALRAIPRAIPTMQDLLLPPVLGQLCSRKQGLILMTGPTGSGKSTTLASLIDIVNRTRQCHIITIEDPVEFVHRPKVALVNQREVGEDTSGFGRALTQAMRQDPDVILVGEMRDLDTISTAITAAETGHLVFATLHTNDTSTALDRIIDVFPSSRQAQIRVQLAASLTAVVAQRLVPRAGGGLIAAFEILLANSGARGLIREGKTHQIRNVISQSVRDGMQTLEQSLSVLVAHGLVSYEDALERSLVPKEVRPPAPVAPAPVGA